MKRSGLSRAQPGPVPSAGQAGWGTGGLWTWSHWVGLGHLVLAPTPRVSFHPDRKGCSTGQGCRLLPGDCSVSSHKIFTRSSGSWASLHRTQLGAAPTLGPRPGRVLLSHRVPQSHWPLLLVPSAPWPRGHLIICKPLGSHRARRGFRPHQETVRPWPGRRAEERGLAAPPQHPATRVLWHPVGESTCICSVVGTPGRLWGAVRHVRGCWRRFEGCLSDQACPEGADSVLAQNQDQVVCLP